MCKAFFLVVDIDFQFGGLSSILNAHTFHHFLDGAIVFKSLVIAVFVNFSFFLNDPFGDELLVITLTESSLQNLPMDNFTVLKLANFEITEDVCAQIGIEIIRFIKGLENLVHFLDSVPFSRKPLVLLKTHFYDILDRKSILGGISSVIVEELQNLCIGDVL